ncbi:MAG: PilZ domain-containing protein [Candidatus Sumerlaeia bacterium]|nr:PilZ domain-containing protein [Candidatus Sumerlaeia bacterium]
MSPHRTAPTSKSSACPELPVREARYPCLFPGMLRVLFPEISFTPLNFAVRVANISCGGALIEIHEGNLEREKQNFEQCLFELRIASGDVPPLYGKIVRSEIKDSAGLFGLRFHRSYPELIGKLVHEEVGQPKNGSPLLPMPLLDPFAPISDEPTIVISGVAKGATEVIVTSEDNAEQRVSVNPEGQFSVKLHLAHQDFNEFRLRSTNGDQSSSLLPVLISYVPLSAEGFHFHLHTGTDSHGNHQMVVDYMGSISPATRIVQELSKRMVEAKHARFSMTLTSTKPYAPKDIQELRQDVEALRKS